MAKVLRCDAIFLGCGHVVRAETEEEVIRLAVDHAREVHGVTEIDAAMAQKVQASIKSE